jgi:hypothetical protein
MGTSKTKTKTKFKTAETVASLIATGMENKDFRRCRVSNLGLKFLIGCPIEHIRNDYLLLLKTTLDSYHGIIMTDLSRGGYGLLKADSLDGAPFLNLVELT